MQFFFKWRFWVPVKMIRLFASKMTVKQNEYLKTENSRMTWKRRIFRNMSSTCISRVHLSSTCVDYIYRVALSSIFIDHLYRLHLSSASIGYFYWIPLLSAFTEYIYWVHLLSSPYRVRICNNYYTLMRFSFFLATWIHFWRCSKLYRRIAKTFGHQLDS